MKSVFASTHYIRHGPHLILALNYSKYFACARGRRRCPFDRHRRFKVHNGDRTRFEQRQYQPEQEHQERRNGGQNPTRTAEQEQSGVASGEITQTKENIVKHSPWPWWYPPPPQWLFRW